MTDEQRSYLLLLLGARCLEKLPPLCVQGHRARIPPWMSNLVNRIISQVNIKLGNRSLLSRLANSGVALSTNGKGHIIIEANKHGTGITHMALQQDRLQEPCLPISMGLSHRLCVNVALHGAEAMAEVVRSAGK